MESVWIGCTRLTNHSTSTLLPKVWVLWGRGLAHVLATEAFGQKFRQLRTHLHHILVSTVQTCKPMIQNDVEKFRPVLGLSFTQQNIFGMLNIFWRNQLIKDASVTDFSSTSVKKKSLKKYCRKTSLATTFSWIGGYYLYQLLMFRGVWIPGIAFRYSDMEC